MRKRIRKINKRKDEKGKRIFLIILLSLIVVVLSYFNINIWKERQEMQKHFHKMKSDYENLSATLNQEEHTINIEEEIERRAREELLLKKEGEKIIIITRDEDSIRERATTMEEEVKDKKTEGGIEEPEKTFFEKILNIFKKKQ